MGTGIGHLVPLVAYLGFWVMCLLSLTGRPHLGLYYTLPFLPYRTMRDHFLDYPLGANILTILILAVIAGAIFRGKRLPKSKLYIVWIFFAIYLYLSMWIGTAFGNAPPPLWLSDANFTTWKDYMFIPLVFIASGLVVEDRKALRTVVLLSIMALFFIDRSSLLESLSRSWTSFNEDKRSGGPLGYGANQTAAYMAEFGMFTWGVGQFVKAKKKLICYIVVALTIAATMYTFSRGAYLAILFSGLILGLLKDRKILIILAVFLVTWQAIVPTPVRQRVLMTKNSNGQLEASAQERVDLWADAEEQFIHSPIVGNGFATFQYGQHVANLGDTHNWYVKVLVETGLIGFFFALVLLQQAFSTAYRLFRRATDPLYRGLGLGLVLAISACVVVNMFGDRWTYLEITGPLWVLVSVAIRANEFSATEAMSEPTRNQLTPAVNPMMAYR